MEMDNDKCDISECIESIAVERIETEHASEHQDQVPRLDAATPAPSLTGERPEDVAQPLIVWRGLMLQQ